MRTHHAVVGGTAVAGTYVVPTDACSSRSASGAQNARRSARQSPGGSAAGAASGLQPRWLRYVAIALSAAIAGSGVACLLLPQAPRPWPACPGRCCWPS